MHTSLWIGVLITLQGREVLLFYRWRTETQREYKYFVQNKQEIYLRDGLNQRGCFHYISGTEQPDCKTTPRLLMFFYICCCNFGEGCLAPALMYYISLSFFTSFLWFFPLRKNLSTLSTQGKAVWRPLNVQDRNKDIGVQGTKNRTEL